MTIIYQFVVNNGIIVAGKLMNIYPYNYYFLYATILLTVIFLIVTLVHLSRMQKSFKAMNEEVAIINSEVKEMDRKTKVIKKEADDFQKKYGWLKTAVPIALAIHLIYKKNDDLKGVKGYQKATKVYMNDANAKRKLVQAVTKTIAKK